MTTRITTHRLVLPKPWTRLPLRGDIEGRVDELVSVVVARAPKDVPPDTLAPWRREIKRRLLEQALAAREKGGVDLYLPIDTMHGFLLGASFIVSELHLLGKDLEGPVLAELLTAKEGSTLVTLDGAEWVRTEEVVGDDPTKTDLGLPTRRVTYAGPIPDGSERWVLAAFSCVGDGDPHGEVALLTTELFDAIMGTWRWVS